MVTHSTDKSPCHPVWLPYLFVSNPWDVLQGGELIEYDPKTGKVELFGIPAPGEPIYARFILPRMTPTICLAESAVIGMLIPGNDFIDIDNQHTLVACIYSDRDGVLRYATIFFRKMENEHYKAPSGLFRWDFLHGGEPDVIAIDLAKFRWHRGWFSCPRQRRRQCIFHRSGCLSGTDSRSVHGYDTRHGLSVGGDAEDIGNIFLYTDREGLRYLGYMSSDRPDDETGVCADFVLSPCVVSPDRKKIAIGAADRLSCVYICTMEYTYVSYSDARFCAGVC